MATALGCRRRTGRRYPMGHLRRMGCRMGRGTPFKACFPSMLAMHMMSVQNGVSLAWWNSEESKENLLRRAVICEAARRPVAAAEFAVCKVVVSSGLAGPQRICNDNSSSRRIGTLDHLR